MVALENASSLNFPDHFQQMRGPVKWPRTSFGIPPDEMETPYNCRHVGGDVSAADTIYGASTYDQASSQDSCPGSENVCKVDPRESEGVPLRSQARQGCYVA
ncbi:hypothetical protein M758_UG037400 [Ceratodon purpureus]|nr:hypothetical protein M758_UG037400 [Ceratodon purpureus]